MQEQKTILFDNHGRPINYVRLAVTDRCNLRCFYCMPENGIDFSPKSMLMTYEEMLLGMQILSEMGITKVRITGGEPFVRNGLINFLEKLSFIKGIEEISITTNGVLTEQYIAPLKEIGIKKINLSLDSLDPKRFLEITRRDDFNAVYSTFIKLIENDFNVKINAVVMDNKNIEDIIPLAKLTKDFPVSVRFIEEMPFNGKGLEKPILNWNHKRIFELLENNFGTLKRENDKPSSTSQNYSIDNHKGLVGIIPAFSRTFCGTCNRIRITPQGDIKTCLYGDNQLNIKNLIRENISPNSIKKTLNEAFNKRAKNGFEAENSRSKQISESMTSIGG